LAGDALLRSLRRQFQALSSTPIVGFQDSSVYLADFGVETNRDGSLSFNAETFSKTFDANPDAFAAITNSRITSSSNLVTTSVIGTQPEAGIYAFALAADGSATLDGSAMTESNGSYTISDSDAGDLKLSLVGGGNNATIYVGKSILDTIADFTTNVLRINGELDQKIARFEDDLADYQDEMTQLDERITDLRARYAVRFGAMESVVNSLKNTEQAIDSMMEAWRASLKN
jgi:flagellar hook-associated protein 2